MASLFPKHSLVVTLLPQVRNPARKQSPVTRLLPLTPTIPGLLEAESRQQLKGTVIIFSTFMFYFFLLYRLAFFFFYSDTTQNGRLVYY